MTANNTKWKRLRQARSIIGQNRLTQVALCYFALIILAAIFAPALCPYDYAETHTIDALQGPSSTYLLGTDQFGRDILSRLLIGSRTSLIIGVGVASMALLIGGVLGASCAWLGGWYDIIIMRVMDIVLAFPSTLLAIVLSVLVKPSVFNMILIISVHRVPQFARITRSAVLKAKEMDYVESARVIGQKPLDILLQHVIPNSLTPIVVYVAFTIAGAINTEASLSFLGVGLTSPAASWGTMLADARGYLLVDPWFMMPSAFLVVCTVLSANILGDALRDLLDPRVKDNA